MRRRAFPASPQGLLQALSLWERMKGPYAKTVGFFHATWNRQLYCHNLVPDAFHWKFKGGPPAFDGGRNWGIIDQTSAWLLEREEVSRAQPICPLCLCLVSRW